MSNRTQTPRGRQPEWNAPLVSLPDISQIINGDTDVTQPIAVSVSGNATPNQGHAQKAPEPVITAAELVPNSNETSSSEYSPILVAKNPSAMQAQQPTEKQRSTAEADMPKAVSIPSVENALESAPHNPSAAGSAHQTAESKKVELATSANDTDGRTNARKKMWTNVMICAGSIVATVAILSAFTGNDNSDDATIAQDRQPLHNEPLDDATAEIPVVELEESTADMPRTAHVAASTLSPETMTAGTPLPEQADEQYTGIAEEIIAKQDLGWQRPPTEAPLDNRLAADPIDMAANSPLPSQHEAATKSEPLATNGGNEQNEFRHIQRYEPTDDSFLQPPANSRVEPTDSAPAYDDKNFSNTSTQSGLIQNKFVNQPETRSVANEEPYYERTSPDRYLWPEGANARAIEFLSSRARRQ